MKDVKGDANAINGQGIELLPGPGTSTAPASVAGADLVSLDVTTRTKTIKGKKVAQGITITLTLGGPVQQGVNYGGTLISSVPCDENNSHTIQVGYEDLKEQQTALVDCQKPTGSGSATATESVGYTNVDAAAGKITWVIDQVPMRRGLALSNFQLTSSVFVLGVFDEFYPAGRFTYAG